MTHVATETAAEFCSNPLCGRRLRPDRQTGRLLVEHGGEAVAELRFCSLDCITQRIALERLRARAARMPERAR